MKRIVTGFAGAVVLSLVLAGPVSAHRNGSPACGGGHHIEADTFKVELTTIDPAARRGETAQVVAQVYRSHDGSTELAPAEGVTVVAALQSHKRLAAASGVTNADGVATIDVRIGTRFPLGWADAFAYASKEAAEVCGGLGEGGRAEQEHFVRIER
jgi:hypothetical protein